MTDLSVVFARPVAHRGLHDKAQGVIENSAGAVTRAIGHGFGIEVDVQLSKDGEAIVFHDATLDRLTAEKGPLKQRTAEELTKIPLTGSSTGDTLWRLKDLLDLVAGRVPLVVEIKSDFSGVPPLVRRVVELVSAYQGPLVLKSFDPLVVEQLRSLAPQIPRGIIGCAFEKDKDWGHLSAWQRFSMRHLLHWPKTRPNFISWHVKDLPRPAIAFAHDRLRAPLMSWTVRTPEDQARAGLYADQMVFEGFLP